MCVLRRWRVTQLFNKAHVLMRIPSHPLEIISRQQARHDLVDEEPLDPLSKIVNPAFLKAWWALREHVQMKELVFFFELTNPIISLEIVFVLTMMVITIYVVLLDEFGGDIVAFLRNYVVESNLALVMVLMVVAVTVTLLVHLEWLLKPYVHVAFCSLCTTRVLPNMSIS